MSNHPLKIAIIAPAFPFRGGIAHHSNMLTRYLRKSGHNVDIITFTRQYPKILYPGGAQIETGDNLEFIDIQSERMIDSINPISWFKTGNLLLKRNYDLVIIKFWLPFFSPSFGTIAKIVRKNKKTKVMIVCENLIPHEKRIGDKILTKFLFSKCDLAVTQSSIVHSQLESLFPKIPQVMLPHPVYENFGDKIDKFEALKLLGIEATNVILFFGFVREYKGLDLLVNAMPLILQKIPDLKLFIVGEFFGSSDKITKQIIDLNIQKSVILHNKYVPNEDVAKWFSASDSLVMPYRSATNSGIVQIAYNFAIPSIVTNVGSLSEVVLNGRTGFVIDDSKPDTIADSVFSIFSNNNLKLFSENIIEERKK